MSNLISSPGQQSLTLSLIAIAVGSMLSPVYADGYGLAQANRSGVKLDKWQCKRCNVSADTVGSVGAGVAYNDGADSHFGNTSGTDEDGAIAHLEAELMLKNESGYQTYIAADKLGYDNGSASLSTGTPGQYEVVLGYRALAHYDTNAASTPYSPEADLLNLPENWRPGATTDQMAELSNSAEPAALKMQRDRFNLGAEYTGHFYQAELDYRHEARTGKQTFNGNLLTNSAMLARPIDDSTDELGAKLYFNGANWLAGVDAMVSRYNNDHEAINWQSAFTPTFGAAYRGQSAAPTDNKAYRIAANARIGSNGHRVLMRTGFSRFSQDEAFLPATINGPSPSLPQPTLDGRVDMIEMSLKYSGRITPELSVRTAYDYKERDNKTEQLNMPQVVTDSYYAGTARNPEYDRTRQQATFAAKYRFTRNTYLDTGYKYDHNRYSDLDRQTLHESGIYARLNYSPSRIWSLGVKAEVKDRSGSEYRASTGTASANNPLMRKSYLADREHRKFNVRATYQPSHAVSVSANLHNSQDDYTDTGIGLTYVESTGYDVSIQYLFDEALSFNAFVNQDWRDSDQAGSTNFGEANWYANQDERSSLVGASVKYENLMDSKLSLGLDYNYSDGQSDTEVTQGVTAQFGDYYSTKHNINAFADYRFSEKLSIRVDWLFEQYEDEDWSNNGLTLDAIPNVLTFSSLSQDYRAHYLGLTLSYHL
ncbi:MtrB/PioB family decaheme-associated outer membrane protein [uncultured Shewanella sp.]|uniref:MtrB/PioB family decaheme-associated outer membrane protein n=1 Tax=uncultured Shewanella sp. TaxID=173975 RepID=UPI002625490D|nr:MtrB/PioB family decaheme-associated outer membrane protein [uncultured Shewanella sp.]